MPVAAMRFTGPNNADFAAARQSAGR